MGSKIGRVLIQSLSEGKSVWRVWKGKKPFWEKFMLMLYLTPILDPVFNTYYNIRGFFRRIKRTYDYARKLWPMNDWDYTDQLEIFGYALGRLDKCMVNGHGLYPKGRRRKMRTAIHLLHRMANEWDFYEEPGWDKLEAKYKKYEDPKARFPSITKRDRMPKKVQEQYSKDIKIHMNESTKLFETDVDMFSKIMKKQMKSWWD
jgi:hypothetical protein